jgi:hypothetical protein
VKKPRAPRKRAAKAAPETTERIGIVLVHGIGEQGRFEHLDGELRPLIKAMVRRANANPVDDDLAASRNVTVEIIGGGEAALHAEHDTWSTASGAPVRIVVRDGNVAKQVYVHEVWWADVNEPYSLWKQVRFWAWGLSIWNIPPKPEFDLPGAEATMALPKFPEGKVESSLSLRARLFGVSNVFAMAAFSLGAVFFVAKRIFGWNAPSVVRIFVNYIGAVKLYSQRRRVDGGFLDAFSEPPRVSIRRRMIRTIADVALADYDRWYVVAHSLGSVVAYNGLNENAHAIPNYLSEAQYEGLIEGVNGVAFAGAARDEGGIKDLLGSTAAMLPARPVWLARDAVVYRDRLYSKFAGLFTYGSPLDKFAAIWPARVPINVTEPGLVFAPGRAPAEWINVYDPTDPVGGNIDAYGKPDDSCNDIVLEPRNFAYAASPLLLYSHLRYFAGGDDRSRLADRLVEWALTGGTFSPPQDASKSRWLDVDSQEYRARRRIAWLTWIAVYMLLVFLGALSLPLWRSLVTKGGGALIEQIGLIWKQTFKPDNAPPPPAIYGWVDALLTLVGQLSHWAYNMLISWWWGLFVSLLTGLWGLLTYLWTLVKSPLELFDWGFVYVGQRLNMPEFATDMLRLMVYVAAITAIIGVLMRFKISLEEPDQAERAAAKTKGGGKVS